MEDRKENKGKESRIFFKKEEERKKKQEEDRIKER